MTTEHMMHSAICLCEQTHGPSVSIEGKDLRLEGARHFSKSTLLSTELDSFHYCFYTVFEFKIVTLSFS